jgi:adenylate cyclase
MGLEIERKFLVVNDSWKMSVESESRLIQGYLSTEKNATIRVRVKGDRAYLTIKGATTGIKRSEYEYEIPVKDAEEMLQNNSLGAVISKQRYKVRCGEHVWDLDLFHGDNEGLVMAEVELSTEDEQFELPDWAGMEVSDDVRYYNANLVENPYRRWNEAQS